MRVDIAALRGGEGKMDTMEQPSLNLGKRDIGCDGRVTDEALERMNRLPLGWSLREMASELRQSRAKIKQLTEALKPFAACVFNDNGDMTVSGIPPAPDFVRAYYAFKDPPTAADT